MKKSRIYLLLSILFLFALACHITGSTVEKTPGAPESKKVLFQDNFANTDSGWNRVRDTSGNITDYENGGYRIFNNQPISHVWANPGLDFKDVHIEVDITKTGGPDDNYFGAVCRYQDGGNFYILAFSSDGYYGIVKAKDGNLALLGSEQQMQPSEAIMQGDVTNHLSAECKGTKLTLWVNGQSLITVDDGDFLDGDVGIEVTTRSQAGVDVLFTNFSVTKP